MARYQMFSTVYWHHTSRAMKAMIHQLGGLAVMHATHRSGGDHGRRAWQSRVLGPAITAAEFRTASLERPPQGVASAVQTKPIPMWAESDTSRAQADSKSDPQGWSDINPLDARMIRWLSSLAPNSAGAQELGRCLLSRGVYARLGILGSGELGEPDDAKREKWVNDLVLRWVKPGFKARDQLRQDIQRRLVTELRERHPAQYREYMELRPDIRPVAILVDVPWKRGEDAELRVIMEPSIGRQIALSSGVWKALAQGLNSSASVPRLYAHPEARNLFKSIPVSQVQRIAAEVLDIG
jgi:hypothetical protein